jgi:hypothetical protein
MRRIPESAYVHTSRSHLKGPATGCRFRLPERQRKRCLVGCAAVLISLWAVSSTRAEAYRLGVWNIERLSPTAARGFPELTGATALPPRTPAQLREIGRYIRDDLAVAALIVTEVEATHGSQQPRSEPLDTIVEEMGPTWEYRLGHTGGSLRVGLMYDRQRIRIKRLAEFPVERFTIQGQDIFDRDPLVAWIALLDVQGQERNDLMLVGLHLKSEQKHKDNHLVAMAKLHTELNLFKADQEIDRSEKDVILLGDLNDSAHRGQQFKYLFDYLAAKNYRHLAPVGASYPPTRVNGSEIDHMFVSSPLVSSNEVAPATFRVHTPTGNLADYRKTFSDHFPLTVAVELKDDKD